MSTQTPPTSAPGFFDGAIAWVKTTAAGIWADITAEAQAIEPDVVAAFDALWSQVTPFAIKAAQEVEKAAASGALLSSEKRSALFSKLESKAQTLGYSVEQQGLGSALNLISEFAVGLTKMATGKSVGKPSNA